MKTVYKEVWKLAPGFESKYEISSLGNVRSLLGKPRKAHLNRYGYYSVTLYKNSKRHTKEIHRIVALAFVSGYFPKAQVNHKNGNRRDSKASNLEWVTTKQNIRHHFKYLNKRNSIEEKKVLLELSISEIQKMKDMRSRGATYALIGSKFRISEASAGRLCVKPL